MMTLLNSNNKICAVNEDIKKTPRFEASFLSVMFLKNSLY